MAIGFPASSKWSQAFTVEPTLLRQLVRQAVERLEWSYETPDAETLVARLPANVHSWGEVVTVRVDAGGTVEAESKCAWPAQIIDWGKNRANLNLFHASLLKTIRNSNLDIRSPSRSVGEDGVSPLERVIRGGDQEAD